MKSKLPGAGLAGFLLLLAACSTTGGVGARVSGAPGVTTTISGPVATVLSTVVTTVTETTTVTVEVTHPFTFGIRTFDHVKVEAGVTRILTDPAPNGYGLQGVSGISCPSNQPVKVDAKFTCTGTVNGTQKQIVITVKDADGKYEVAPPS